MIMILFVTYYRNGYFLPFLYYNTVSTQHHRSPRVATEYDVETVTLRPSPYGNKSACKQFLSL